MIHWDYYDIMLTIMWDYCEDTLRLSGYPMNFYIDKVGIMLRKFWYFVDNAMGLGSSCFEMTLRLL